MPLTGTCTYTISEDGKEIKLNFLESIFAPPPPPPPPPLPSSLWDKTVLQTGFEGPVGSYESFLDDTGRHTIRNGFPGWSELRPEFKLFGNTSHWASGSYSRSVLASPDFHLALNAEDPFCIEYWFRQTTLASYEAVGNSGGGGFSLRHNLANIEFAWFDSDGAHRGLPLVPVDIVANGPGVRICLERNSAGLYRVYSNGVMKYRGTPVNGRIKPSDNILRLNITGGQSWMDALRIMKAAPYDSDGGYQLATGPFPIG